MRAFANPEVAVKFDAYPPLVRKRLLALRELVFRTAEAIDEVGGIEETLKWGEPAYVTRNRSGSTVRMGWKKSDPAHYAMYFHCQTNLVETFRAVFAQDFKFDGNRALVFSLSDEVPEEELGLCIAAALTYHLNKNGKGRVSLEAKRQATQAGLAVDTMPKKSRTSRVAHQGRPICLSDLANLGPKSLQFLHHAGITSVEHLARLGSVEAYSKVKRLEPAASLNLLWALEGAISGVHWREVAKKHRTSLLLALEAYEQGE